MKYIIKNIETGNRYIIEEKDPFTKNLIQVFSGLDKYEVTKYIPDQDNEKLWEIYCEKISKKA